MRKSLRSAEYRKFLELMIAARRSSGLTQAKLAKRLNRHQSFVAKYENGERRLDVIEFLTIAKALGSDPSAILKLINKRDA